MKTYLKRFTLFIFAVLVVGCGLTTSLKERLLHDGYPPSYAEGYEAGYKSSCVPNPNLHLFDCMNNFKGVKFVKELNKGRSYDQGWDDGQKVAISENSAAKQYFEGQYEEYQRDLNFRRQQDFLNQVNKKK
jgi:hypothetical protein